MSRPVLPVVLLGGSGTRLWPVSRTSLPKQFHRLCSPDTMLQATLNRLHEPFNVLDREVLAPVIIGSEKHQDITDQQLREINQSPLGYVLEPMGRNTAPALAAAALMAEELAPEALLLVLPADHHIEDVAAYQRGLLRAVEAAESGHLVTFGVQPDRPETGYGYIRSGDALSGLSGALSVEQFVEKPPLELAREYVQAGTYFWNSGMFLFDRKQAVESLAHHEPKVWECVRAAFDQGQRTGNAVLLEPASFAASPDTSIDYAIMERTSSAAVVPVDIGWSDVGSFLTLWNLGPQDASGNKVLGDAVLVSTKGSYVDSRSRLIATLGVEDLIIVETPDAVLVAHKDRITDLKQLIGKLQAISRPELK